MDVRGVIWLLLAAAALGSVLGEDKPSYFGVGGELVLRVPAPSELIGDILWKHNDEKLVEWSERGGGGPRFYGSFEGRAALDALTAELKITDMREADAGFYSVEINLTDRDPRYVARAVEETPRPHIWLSPVACSAAVDRCTLSCEGAATPGAQPVEYSWRMGDGEWRRAARDVNITANETSHVAEFSCRAKNPLGEKESEPRLNPFLPAGGTRGALPVWGWPLIVFVLAAVAAGVSFALWKRGVVKCSRRGGEATVAYTAGTAGSAA